MEENIKIENKEEFLKQKEQYIYNSNEYIELRILVGHGDTTPISELHGENVTSEDLARMLCAMRNQINNIINKCPEAFIMSNYMIEKNLNNIFEEGENTYEK